MENMRMTELKSLARDRGLRNYSRMIKTELFLRMMEPQMHEALVKPRVLGPQLLPHLHRGPQHA